MAKRFEDLEVWRKAEDLAVTIYQVSGISRFAQDYALRDQVRRAAISVSSNIAEGFERYSRAEFRHFLSIARGSTVEERDRGAFLTPSLRNVAITPPSMHDGGLATLE